jgi:hypothetical protein
VHKVNRIIENQTPQEYCLPQMSNFDILLSMLFIVLLQTGKGKSKTIPLQLWTGPENSRSLRLPDFKTIGT